MITEEAIVISVTDSFALVEAEEKSACGSCSGEHLCGKGTQGKRRLEVINRIGANPGQKVLIELKSSSFVLGSMIAFLVPTILVLIGLILGSFIGTKMGGEAFGDKMALVGVAAGLFLSYIFVKTISTKLDRKESFHPEIKEIL